MTNRLKDERARRQMTQQELAELAGVSRQTINSIEAARYVPSTLLALKFSAIFHKTVNELFLLEEGEG